MRLRAVLGAAVLSVGCVLVAAVPGASASPVRQELSAVRLSAVWDPADGTPVLALEVFHGTVDVGSRPKPFTWSNIALPTADGSQTSCTPAGTLIVDANLKAAAVTGTYTCADGRSLAVDLRWWCRRTRAFLGETAGA